MTFKQLQALPTDPGKLKSVLKRGIPRDDGRPGRTAGQTKDEIVKNCVTDLLAFEPAPPKVRAAAFRMLAAMPGVTAGGPVTDERGRKGFGLNVRVMRDTTDTVIIDPKSALVLSTTRTTPKRPGTLSKQLYLQVGWTDSEPKIPTLP